MIPDTALGINANFDSDKFRNAIKFAMQMGTPNMPLRPVRFIRKSAGRRYFLDNVEQFPPPDGTLRLDRDGKPLNPDVRTTQAADELEEIDCAIEITDVPAAELPVGKFLPVKAEVTVLDVDYPKIEDCRELLYNNDRYQFGYEPTDYGLFGVDVHTLVFYALDES